ncbi:protein GrpE isoform X2 [Rhodamnia argentea]|uniref:Protein GrpE isoform X2 n=1 Tax=Rhodamnia argentea TaxID=178133 RepID=A0ABM3H414_9MYRT|nr:protein GrpE isoform X2 [Rhodamnia argentea]
MALFISNHSVFVLRLAPCPPPPTSRQPISLLRSCGEWGTSVGLSTSLPSSRSIRGCQSRPSPGCPLVSAPHSAHSAHSSKTDGTETSSEGMQPSGPSDNMQESVSLNKLIEVFREAFLSGDEKTVYEVEARMCNIEVLRKQLIEQVSTLSEEMTSGKESYIRLQADFDNFRKRSEKERLTKRSDAQREIIESLLSMVDNFERAKQQIKPETEKEKKIDASYQGIYKQFVEVMRSLHVSAIASLGKPFDPSLLKFNHCSYMRPLDVRSLKNFGKAL